MDLDKLKLLCSAVISCIVLVGGGVIIALVPESRDQVGVLMGGVVGHWFAKSPNGNGANRAYHPTK